jgi:hypothetical protein
MAYIFLHLWLAWISTALHPIHISVTEVNYNTAKKSFEITHKIFIDDFEDALGRTDSLTYRLGTPQEHPEMNQYIQKYMDAKFKIKVNQKPQTIHFVGKETDLEAIWIYQEVRDLPALARVEFHHSVLTELFDDQKNILHFRFRETRKSFLFKKDTDVSFISL